MKEKQQSPWKLVFFAIIAGSIASSVFAGCGSDSAPPASLPAGPPQVTSPADVPDEAEPASPDVSPEPAAQSPPRSDVSLVHTSVSPPVPPEGDWPQWGGTSLRNNSPQTATLPDQWKTGKFDRRTGKWDSSSSLNIRWVANLGSQTYGNPVVAGDKVFIGTNNGAGYLPRFPAETDLGCLLCFDRKTGEFLWQHSSEKLASGRVHDWPLQGICSTPLVEGDRLWFVTSRGEVRCLDTEGFRDGEDDGIADPPEIVADPNEADVVWVYDMMAELGVSQRNMASSSVTAAGDLLFLNTGNGTGESGTDLPAPEAPSFICLDKQTGELVWADASPGDNILHGQWSSPAAGTLGGVAQVIFAGGDGYLYSFAADRGVDGRPTLLWKFDCNPKESTWSIAGDGDRNYIIGTPVIHNGAVYIAVGQDPELGEAEGCLWCVDPTRRGDVSPELAVRQVDGETVPIAHQSPQAVDPARGEKAIPNPNSAALWHYRHFDSNGDGEISFDETMHRTMATIAIRDELLYVVDLAGIMHCVDAATGAQSDSPSGSQGDANVARQGDAAKAHYTFDLEAQSWSSPLITDGRVFVADEDGDITVFEIGREHSEPVAEINMGSSLYTTPVAAGDTLFISTRDRLFAIGYPLADQ